MDWNFPWIQALTESLTKLIEHTVVTIAALLSMFLIHLALKYLLGEDAILLDFLKVRYLIDIADIAILIRLPIVLLLDIWNIFKNK
jgi:hypothetical protein